MLSQAVRLEVGTDMAAIVPSVTDQDRTSTTNKATIVLAILSAAMFIYVIDTTIMNVSISALVEDLGTTVGEVQTAITLYTLTMAAFMLTGGKLGDIWGSKRAFRIGLVIYGVGTIITALAPNIGFIILGWSVLEGLGSALIVPAINTLVRANFTGTKRASAYGTLFGVAAAGAAFGPLIGGWLTANLSWRVAFAGEAIIVVIVLLTSGLLINAPAVIPKPRLDFVGVALSATGLGLFVYGILRTSTFGWSDPLVISFIFVGLAVVGTFVWWVGRRETAGKPALVHPSIFKHRAISAGLPILATQTFAQAGLLFLIPVFAQSVLGFDAFQTGLTLLPLSIGVLATSTLTPRLGRKIYPKYIIQAGLVLLFIGGYVLARSLDGASRGTDLALGLLIGGVAIGLVVGQLPNLILSGVDQDEASEASGLQGTAQNLGMALGTAVIGTVVLSVALTSLGNQVQASPIIPSDVKEQIAAVVERPFVSADAGRLAEDLADLPAEQKAELRQIYDKGTLRGFQGAILAGGIVALFGALMALRLPRKKLESDSSVEATVCEVVRSSPLPGLQLEMDDLAPSTKP
ncbi:MAG: MFS transporter [Acidimicrobiia bacterium]|nr:MAG: MFS transporter [Acidimicrobiia bacterium]